jgi:hypothetical protein
MATATGGVHAPPAPPPRPRRRPLARALQLGALTLVAALLALLLWRVLDAGHGAGLVNALEEGITAAEGDAR